MFSRLQIMLCVLWVITGLVLDIMAMAFQPLRILCMVHIVTFAAMWGTMGGRK